MFQICYICKLCYGEKAPFDDESETHGLCPTHFESEMKKIDSILKKEEEEKAPDQE